MGFGNLRIVSCKHTPIDAPYGIRKSWSFISTIRTVKKEISWHFIFITTAEDCVSESSKLCLNLCSKDDTCLHVIMASNTGEWEGLYSTPPPPTIFCGGVTFTRCSLLVEIHLLLITRCEIICYSLQIARYFWQKLVVGKISCYLWQNLLVAKNSSLLVGNC